MRILQIGLSPFPGGIERFVMNYYEKLIQYDMQFDFICMYKTIAYEEKILQYGGKIYYLPNVKKRPVLFAIKLKKILKMYDIVHINMLSAANIVPLIMAKWCKVRKIILHAHNSNTEGALRYILHKVNKRFLRFLGTDFVACSNMASEWLFDDKIRSDNRVKILHNAIDVEKYRYKESSREGIRRELEMDTNLIIGNVGRLSYQKNLSFLIKVFSKVAQKNANARLILVGNGSEEEKLMSLVEQYNIKQKVKFLGLRSDVAEIYSAIDIFCMPSYFEGLSFTAIEAQASGALCLFSQAMSMETKVVENVEFLPIGDEKIWVNRIMKFSKIDRNSSELETLFNVKGYNINTEVRKMLLLYDIQNAS